MNELRYPNSRDHIDRVLSSVSGNNLIAPSDTQTAFINRSWGRCINEYNISPEIPFQSNILTQQELLERQEAFTEIYQLALDSVDKLFSFVSDIDYTILLTDSEGITLDCRYNPEYESILKKQGLYEGTDWSEEIAGTNGIGTCLVEKQPVLIQGEEHFFPSMLDMTCTVSPIFDAKGKLLATLDATTLQPETFAQNKLISRLVEQHARQIETRAFKSDFKDAWLLYFSASKEMSDIQSTGIISLNENGDVIACNRTAFVMLAKRPGRALTDVPLDSVFDRGFGELVDASNHKIPSFSKLRSIVTHEEYFFRLTPPENAPQQFFIQPKSVTVTQKATTRPHPDIEQLAGDDIHLQVVKNKIRQIVNQNLHFLIMGETGTGKEAFAKAIHDTSDRRDAAFVAINCAAIPDSLIESELFGYASGTFTGALKKGMKGKVLQANQGTLFLDEIGDMPLHLQTRLLRVLSEMEVVPLGETQPIALDIQLISATNKNILNMIEENSFRSDLYFRLNGVTLELPSLRNRSDKQQLVTQIFQQHSNDSSIQIDHDALALLTNYKWPGNIRQLINVAKYTNAMCTSNKISLNDLPDEIKHTHVSPLNRGISNYSEHDLLFNSLKENKWNITKVAKQLNICRATVYRKMKQFDILPPNDQ